MKNANNGHEKKWNEIKRKENARMARQIHQWPTEEKKTKDG